MCVCSNTRDPMGNPIYTARKTRTDKEQKEKKGGTRVSVIICNRNDRGLRRRERRDNGCSSCIYLMRRETRDVYSFFPPFYRSSDVYNDNYEYYVVLPLSRPTAMCGPR